MPRGPTIADILRGQIVALHRECIPYRKITGMLNCSFDAVQSVIRLGFKPKAPKKRIGNQNISLTQQRAVVRMELEEEDSAKTIQGEPKLPIGRRTVQQILRAVPYPKLTKDNGTTDDPHS